MLRESYKIVKKNLSKIISKSHKLKLKYNMEFIFSEILVKKPFNE